ncbi:MalY/PatB family protein [Facklamia miroungae]|uniref:cysteine-S-conjugate beta-lyase n=1 Tax=Facklamia miroungae TaxID=120956 RepID=A0A1G7UST8_9LACT|nr:MalY/PatB family protein [Facklamia miroungae]NKZ30161.1 pyridoxal phosphate-dependent aminotransferase [Facklamia miroungae]SDG49790.1 aminotransferase/cystathione beta-lyase [Facklamia miroungae]
MAYDFKTCVDRTQQGSRKWLLMRESGENIPEGIAPLSVADLDFPMAPGIIEGLKKDLDELILGYTIPNQAYYDAVKKWMKDQHQWEVQEDWLVTAPGVVPAINVFVNAFTKEGDGIIVLEPVYGPFSAAIDNHDRKKIAVDLINTDGYYTIDFEALELAAKDAKAMIFCSPHNPVGRVWKKEELEKVAEICRNNNLYLFSDEIHFDLAHKNYKHHVFANLSDDIAQHVIVATAPSKTFNLAGLQTSNIFIPNPEWRQQYIETAEKMNLISVPALGLYACKHAYNNCLDWKEELVELIEENYQMAKSMIEAKLPGIVVTPMEASYLLWLDLTPLNMECDEIIELLESHHIYINNGLMFGSCGEGYIRIHLALPKDVVKESIERFIKALENIK